MKKYIGAALLIAAAGISLNAYAQVASDVANDNAANASNSGLNLINGGGGTSKAWSLLFPSHAPSMSTNGKGCTGSGTTSIGLLWNLFRWDTPSHEMIQGCGAPDDVSMLGRMCQFYDARVLLDDHLLRVYKIDVTKQHPEGVEAYKKWRSDNFKNQTFQECAKLLVNETKTDVKPVAGAGIDKTTKVIKLSTLTLFKTAQHQMTAAGTATLLRALVEFDPKHYAVARVSGHTDNVGNVPANQSLSERRADTVARFLRAQGFTVDSVQGYGKTLPLAQGNTSDTRAMNRRVEIEMRQIFETQSVSK